MSFNFKSSGTKKIKSEKDETKIVSSTFYTNNSEESITKIGIKTPLRLGYKNGDEIFVMNTKIIDQISDNVKNLLLTNHGERLGRYDYGGNLLPLLTEQSSLEDIESSLMERIKKSIEKWMPFVSLLTLSYVKPSSNSNTIEEIEINLQFSVPILSNESATAKINLRII